MFHPVAMHSRTLENLTRQGDVHMKLEQRSPWNWKAEPEAFDKANKLNLQLPHLTQNSQV